MILLSITACTQYLEEIHLLENGDLALSTKESGLYVNGGAIDLCNEAAVISANATLLGYDEIQIHHQVLFDFWP